MRVRAPGWAVAECLESAINGWRAGRIEGGQKTLAGELVRMAHPLHWTAGGVFRGWRFSRTMCWNGSIAFSLVPSQLFILNYDPCCLHKHLNLATESLVKKTRLTLCGFKIFHVEKLTHRKVKYFDLAFVIFEPQRDRLRVDSIIQTRPHGSGQITIAIL